MSGAESIAFRWQPIEDLATDYPVLAKPELGSLAAVWQEQRELLSSEAEQVFLEKLQRQWAIETGIIERIYSLDRGVTQVLIEKGIEASLISHEATDHQPELVAAIIKDQKFAVESLFDFVKGDRVLSTAYIKELHALLTRHQESTAAVDSFGNIFDVRLERGAYKSLPNNPTRRPDGRLHEYCPPEHTASEMDRFVELHHRHDAACVPPEIEAAWVHHRFSQIHPFQDGNGRVARALASLVFIKAGWFPLVVTRDDREQYIAALEDADKGTLNPLVDLFAAMQRKAFVGALGIAADVRQRERVDQVIQAARDLLEKRQGVLRLEWERVKETALQLEAIALQRFQQVADHLNAELGKYSAKHSFYVDSEPNGGDRDFYFRHQIVQTAKDLGYSANTSAYSAWIRLVLRTETQSEILLSIHGIGREFRGLLVASMCFFRREEVEEGERELVELSSVSQELLQFNYKDTSSQAKDRFHHWMEDCLVKGLEMWRKGL